MVIGRGSKNIPSFNVFVVNAFELYGNFQSFGNIRGTIYDFDLFFFSKLFDENILEKKENGFVNKTAENRNETPFFS